MTSANITMRPFIHRTVCPVALAVLAAFSGEVSGKDDAPYPQVRDPRRSAFLGWQGSRPLGHPLRQCSHERRRHGTARPVPRQFHCSRVNCVGFYIQGSNGGWPDVDAGRNGFTAEGALKPESARRLEWLVRESDKRGMVVMIGLFSPRKDQELKGEQAVQRAIEETAKFLVARKLQNVFVDLMHEFNSPRVDLDIFREPDGAAKKAKLTRWFKKFAPDIPAGVCPSFNTNTADSYPGMDVRIIQKGAEIPDKGFVVNIETPREDAYDNDGVFTPEARKRMTDLWHKYRSRPNAHLLFHSAFTQGITDKSGTGPHPEMGGNGTRADDRGVRFYFEWVRENVEAYEYPGHAKGRK
jgi:hypothetical protein